jgi:hypothetical protein
MFTLVRFVAFKLPPNVPTVTCTPDLVEAGFQFPRWGYYVVGGTGALVFSIMIVFIVWKCCCKNSRFRQFSKKSTVSVLEAAPIQPATTDVETMAIPATLEIAKQDFAPSKSLRAFL